jgi:hypothetical protein
MDAKNARPKKVEARHGETPYDAEPPQRQDAHGPAPPHPVLEAVAALDPFEDNAPESLRVGRLRELRRHLIQTAVTFLQDRPTGNDAWSDAEVTARGLGYVAAVGRYIRSVSASFPVDPTSSR